MVQATTDLKELQADELEFNDPPRLVWIRVKDAIGLLWDENPKLHDIGGVVLSLQKHGYQEFPKFDINLKNVKGKSGAIKAGNGRIESLWRMEADKMDLPRGLAKIKESGDWAVAIGVGVDAASAIMAKAYAVDSNNLTMSGGNFDGFDFARMWDEKSYTEVLKSMISEGISPVSVTPEDLDVLSSAFERPEFTDIIEEFAGTENKKQAGDEKWFYIEYYGDSERWDKMYKLLETHLKTQHQLNEDFFFDMVLSHLNGKQ